MENNEPLQIAEIDRMIAIGEREIRNGSQALGLGILQRMMAQIELLEQTANVHVRRQLDNFRARATAALLNRPEPARPIQQQPVRHAPQGQAPALNPRDLEVVPDDSVFLTDIVGLKPAKEALCQMIALPEAIPERVPASNRWSGLLLYGPSGVGKTKLVRAFMNSYARSMRNPVAFLHVTSDILNGNFHGDTERNLTAVFNAAQEFGTTVVLLFDEVDTLCGKRGRPNQLAGTNNITNHFLQLLDGVRANENLFIIGTTNLVHQIDDAFFRRFYMVFCNLPDKDERRLILEKCVDRIRRPGWPSLDLHALAAATEDYSPHDLWRIVTLANMRSGTANLADRVLRYFEQGREIQVEWLGGDEGVLTTANLFDAKSEIRPSNSDDVIRLQRKFYREHGGNGANFENNRSDSDCGCINWWCTDPLKALRMTMGECNRFLGCD